MSVNLVHAALHVPSLPSCSPLSPSSHHCESSIVSLPLRLLSQDSPSRSFSSWVFLDCTGFFLVTFSRSLSARLLLVLVPGAVRKPRSPRHHPCVPRYSLLLLRGLCPQGCANTKNVTVGARHLSNRACLHKLGNRPSTISPGVASGGLGPGPRPARVF
ncbi:unnamed protein product [Pylaiella littoralis]